MNEMQSCSFPRASRTVCPDISVSFEFFPPATEAMEATLWAVSYTHLTLPTNREV